ncbi:DJ-1/PfpI family protein [Niveispirillum sp. KHB5.9]|uniref:DJ-1/PfpI family protein n=1 Tax=Niveispirillum sp. KHB5.9 TaxID=3400269 RepID=UPI003A846C0A
MNHMIDRRSFAAMGLAGSAALLTGGSVQAAQPQALEGEGTRAGKKTRVAMLLYPGTTVLDWVGPYEALHRVEGVEVVLAAKSLDLMKSDSGIMDYKANATFDQIDRTDVLLVPGGAKGLMDASNDPATMDWLRRMDSTSVYTVGICTGSLMLSHAGLLKGKRATTYWKFTGMLDQAGSTFVPERWVRDGKYWTSAGVSAGIDLTLALIADLYGPKRAMMAQLAIEYDPHPPFNAGSSRTAPPEVVQALGG